MGNDGDGILVGEPGGLGWNELMTRDAAKASEFYGKLTGWQFTQMPMDDFDYTMASSGETPAAGFMPMSGPDFEGVPPHWLVYIAVADCDEIANKISQTGGKLMVPPTDTPVARFSIAADPQGAVFAVIALTEQNY
ncbi:MAG: putative enzyme related to lactoylglutathione lyase [Planctomycetota bacterium]